MQQGLSSNNVTNILQDSKGYIWIGTEDGLNKYDGYSFTKYKFDPLDSNSLSQNMIYTIWEDKEGFIWTSSYEGLCKFDRKTEKFTRYKPDPRSKFSDPNILSINEDNNGIMWVGGASGQLCRFDKHTGKFYNESFDLGFHKQSGELLHDGVNCIFKDKEGLLWVGNTTGLHKINIQSAKAPQPGVEHYLYDPQNPNGLSGKLVLNIFEDHAGILWIATDNGLNCFDKKTHEFKHYMHDPKNKHSVNSEATTGQDGQGNQTLGTGSNIDNMISEDKEGNLWIGTDNGLYKLNKDRTVFTSYTHHAGDPNSLNADYVSSIFIDRSGILWAGSGGKGLDKANLVQKPFGLRQNDPLNIYSLSDNHVTAISEDNSGTVWIGTDEGGLNRWDKKTDQFVHYSHDQNDPGTLRYDYVFAMLNDSQGNLWVCNGDMLSLLNKQTGKFTHYNSNAANYNDIDHLSIYSITEDRDGLIWLGTGNGIKSFDKKTGTFNHYYHNPEDTTGISDYTAQAIFADSKNNIWVGLRQYCH